ncbi:hypothetical protein Tco_0947329 [Tanacetum coccineum]
MECLVTRFMVMILREFGLEYVLGVGNGGVSVSGSWWKRGRGGDMVVSGGIKGCLVSLESRSSPIIPPYQRL